MQHGNCRVRFKTEKEGITTSNLDIKKSFGHNAEIKLSNINSSQIAIYRLHLSIKCANIKDYLQKQNIETGEISVVIKNSIPSKTKTTFVYILKD